MRSPVSPSARRLTASRGRQRGQALIYGIFILVGGLASLFFLFNTGQLTREKTKLTNTADAVAYAAGVLHARALNFDAYSNRALVANEVLVAQMVSLSSWAQYAKQHIESLDSVFPRCTEPVESYYIPYGGGFYTMAALTGPEYAAACNVVGDHTLGVGDGIKDAADAALDVLPAIVSGIEANKSIIKLAQDVAHTGMIAARGVVMDQVAKANYRNDGDIDVDLIPTVLTSDWGGFTTKYSNDDRARFAEVTRLAAYGPSTGDAFVRSRSWTASQLIPTNWQCMVLRWQRNQVRRRGGTELINYDEWKAEDTASYHFYTGGFKWWGGLTCNHREDPLGWGEQEAHPDDADQDESGASLGGSPGTNPAAHARASSDAWTSYTGLPSFYDLSSAMLAKNSNLKEDDAALLKYTVRVRRQIRQTVTSEGRSDIKVTPTLNGYKADAAKDLVTHTPVLAQIATSEVFFRRPPDAYQNSFGGSAKPVELGNLFNPYWQVRLVTTPSSDFTAAKLMQGSVGF